MLQWISTNLSTILICIVLLAIVIIIIRSLIRQKKQGKSSAAPAAHTAPCTANAIRGIERKGETPETYASPPHFSREVRYA